MSDNAPNTSMTNKTDQKSSASPNPPVIKRRGGQSTALGQTVGKLTGALFGRRGLSDGMIIKNWHLIAGEHVAKHTMPEKVSYSAGRKTAGTLHLRVGNSGLATEIQHLEPLLIERINAHFGYQAVGKLRLIHGPLSKKWTAPPPYTPRALSAQEETELSSILEEIEDPNLRKTLEDLGRSVYGRSRP